MAEDADVARPGAIPGPGAAVGSGLLGGDDDLRVGRQAVGDGREVSGFDEDLPLRGFAEEAGPVGGPFGHLVDGLFATGMAVGRRQAGQGREVDAASAGQIECQLRQEFDDEDEGEQDGHQAQQGAKGGLQLSEGDAMQYQAL